MEAEVVEYLINYLKQHFGKLKETRVKNPTFWGINIDITEYKKAEIYMKEIYWNHLEKILMKK